jgi:hypothetical protein
MNVVASNTMIAKSPEWVTDAASGGDTTATQAEAECIMAGVVVAAVVVAAAAAAVVADAVITKVGCITDAALGWDLDSGTS